MRINWQSASQTNIGNVRDLNEDAFLDCTEKQLWVVADGMGGHQAGDLASQMIITLLSDFIPTEHLGKNIDHITHQLKIVNTRLLELAKQRKTEIIGSTIVLFHANGRHCVCVWAGDSRIYRYREGLLLQITRDHTYAAELNEQSNNQLHMPEFAEDNSAITRAVGGAEEINLEYQMMEIRTGDLYLLCSDGLTGEVSDDEIACILSCYAIEKSIEQLIMLATKRAARDNITAVLLNAM